MNEWWDRNTFFTKIYISLFLKRVKTSVNVRATETERRSMRTHTGGGLLYWPFLFTHVIISYSGPYVFASLTSGSQPGSAWAVTHHDCITVRMWVPTHSSGRDSRDLLPLVNPHELSFCLHGWNILSLKYLIWQICSSMDQIESVLD